MYAHCRMKIVHTEGREARTEIRKALDRTCNCDVTKLFLVSTYKDIVFGTYAYATIRFPNYSLRNCRKF